ncbi:hypothetical protein CHS0354_033866 [Potamilus streckersoni]|uniref:Ubiquitin-like domain-containing protein n=1 Tax=Potamilus streckersoni TaxID=2493646 RepID=A0AAE0RWP9_9BIVA|nr:hypothetical protein CHS0354_033866 [Potamilus streckersoni]
MPAEPVAEMDHTMPVQSCYSNEEPEESNIFVLFVVLPNEEVRTLRDLPSGITILYLKAKLELIAGIPAQIYTLIYPDGEVLEDSRRLIMQENIRDGYLLRMQLYENWESLYVAVTKNNIEHVFHSGGVHLRGNIIISQDETEKYYGVVTERGAVALYMASFLGLYRMVNMLLTVGVSCESVTHFGRTPFHAAVARDNENIIDLLLRSDSRVASVADWEGKTPMNIAREFSAIICTKKLRLMQINLRGMHSGGPFFHTRTKVSVEIPRVENSSAYTKFLKKQPQRPVTVADARLGSVLSQSSSVSLRKVPKDIPMQKSRKHISASAPLKEASTTNLAQSYKMAALSGKRVVTWQDIPNNNQHWHVVEFHPKRSSGGNTKSSTRTVTVLQQKKVLKFKNDPDIIYKYEPEQSIEDVDDNDDIPQSGLADTNQQNTDTSHSLKTPSQSNRLSKSMRILGAKYRKESHDNRRTMYRRINMVANQNRSDDSSSPKVHSDAFNQWLVRKRLGAERADDSNDSNQSESESDSEKNFPKRFRWKRKGEEKPSGIRPPGGRPVPNLIQTGSTAIGDSSGPPANTHIRAYKVWFEKNKRQYGYANSRRKTLSDFMSEKKKLEQKRQKLLLSAQTYEEWMDHTSEKQLLIDQILKANLEELKRIEEENFKARNVFSFEDWKEKLQIRELDEHRRQQVIQKAQEEIETQKKLGQSSSAVPFRVWLSKKKEAGYFSNFKDTDKEGRKVDNAAKRAEMEAAYEKWLTRKHTEEMKAIENQIKKEYMMPDALNETRMTSAVN